MAQSLGSTSQWLEDLTQGSGEIPRTSRHIAGASRRVSLGLRQVDEGLRGLAAFMVMWWHLRHWVTDARGPDALGYTGVDLFIVLSGFVFAPYVFGTRAGRFF